ncbi:MAG: glycosyltransferase, partial [Candidatus Electrothrix sp. ATG2]|nr:glycosyltransferase [Candidatus Electrothrix sp. ATG2]
MNNVYAEALHNRTKDTSVYKLWQKTTHYFSKKMKEIFSPSVIKESNTNLITREAADFTPFSISNSKTIESIKLLGVRVHLVTEKRLNEYIANVIEKGRKELVLNVNVHCYNMIFKNPWMRDFFNKAEMVFCDGCGVALGAKILGLRTPIRFTPADSIWSLAALAEEKGHSFYFLGAKKGIAEKAAQKMQERYPDLKITTHHGYFNKDRNSAENQKIIQEINASKANILVVGFGMPIQEKWLQENWDQLNVNIGFPAGALFDYVSGELRRGPRWMTENDLEWLARMLIEPKRLWKRYFIGNTVFLHKIITHRLENVLKSFLQHPIRVFKALLPEKPHKQKDLPRHAKTITFPGSATRLCKRLDLLGYTAKIIGSNNVSYSTTIKNVSLDGLQVQGIPAKFDATNEGPLTVIVSN